MSPSYVHRLSSRAVRWFVALTLVACSGRADTADVPLPQNASPIAAASDAALNDAEGIDASAVSGFYAFLRDFCAAIEMRDDAYLRAHVTFPIVMRALQHPETCGGATVTPCRYRSVTLGAPSALYAAHVCHRDQVTSFEDRFPLNHIRWVETASSWVVNDEVGQFGTWMWFERAASTYRLIRYADDAAPPKR